MNPWVTGLNTAVAALYAREYRALLATTDVQAIQLHRLRAILTANADSEVGRRLGFASIRTMAQYRARIPLVRHEDLTPDIDRIADGAQGVLTTEPVTLLEPSSGSSAATKLIPYTASLQAQFQTALRAWLHDLFANHSGVAAGRSYWSITPVTSHTTRSPGGIPIGFQADSQYFGRLGGALVSRSIISPPGAASLVDVDAWRTATATALLGARDLALISVWNPTLMLGLLDHIANHADEVLANLPSRWTLQLRPAIADGDWMRVWPHLRLVSCWADAAAADPAARLAAALPQAELQPKGLLATEGFVSVPIKAAGGPVLAARSHVLEFLTDDGTMLGAHELEPGVEAQVVLTTGGGLYRYQLGDRIRVQHLHGALPVVRFLGKEDLVTDLVGEKLNERFVRGVLDELAPGRDFGLLSPDGERYLLHCTQPVDPAALDCALRANVHYAYARDLGQLQMPDVIMVAGNTTQTYLGECVRRGQRLGDIKASALHRQGGWGEVFIRA